ncbi:hypothetical protein [Galenea microaerophila]
MKKPYALVLLMTLLGVIVGWGTGSYLTGATARAALDEVPAAPVVIASGYDEKSKTLSLTFTNAGGQPIDILGKGLTFKPKQGDGYALAFTQFEQPIRIEPFSVATLRVKLKADTATLVNGDVVATTIQYAYPLLPDVFEMTHMFVKGHPTDKKSDKKSAASAAK